MLNPPHRMPEGATVTNEDRPRFYRLFRWLWRLLLPPVRVDEPEGITARFSAADGDYGPRVHLSRIDAENGRMWAALSHEHAYLNSYEVRLHAAELLELADMMDAKNATERMLRETLGGGR